MLAIAGLILRVLGLIRILPLFGIISGVLGGVASAFVFASNLFAALPTPVKKFIGWLLVALALLACGYYGGHKSNADAAAKVQARWDAAVAQTTATLNQAGAAAHDQAEQSVPQVTPADRAADSAIVPRSQPCRVFDPYDRSCAGRSR